MGCGFTLVGEHVDRGAVLVLRSLEWGHEAPALSSKCFSSFL
jgi:hypothetical protein